jgi:uncharacterized protein
MRRLGDFLAHHRRTVWCLILLLSIPPAIGLYGVQLFEPSYSRWTTIDQMKTVVEAREAFPNQFSGFPSFLVLECDDFFQPKRIAALQTAVKRIADHMVYQGGEESLIWIGNIPQVTLFGTRPLLPDHVETLEEAQAAGDVIAAHPLVVGQLLSEDRRTMLIGVFSYEDETWDWIREHTRDPLSEVGIRSRITGPSPLWHAHRNSFDRDHQTIVLIAAVVVVVLAMIIFRGLPAIIVSCSGPGVGVFWTLGWLELLGLAGNDLAEIILPVMILMVGFTDGVHLVVHIRQKRLLDLNDKASVKDRQIAAAASAIEHVGGACLLTSLTTAIGFGSLMLADAEMIQGFGRVCSIGVLIAFVAAMLVIPVMSSSWIGRRIHAGSDRDLVGRVMQRSTWLVDFVIRHSRVVTVVGILVTGFLGVASLSLEPDDRLGHLVPNSSEVYQAMRHCDEALGGVRMLRVVVTWPEDASRATTWQVVTEVESVLNDEPEVSRPLSIRQALSVVPGIDGPAKLGMVSLLPRGFGSQFWQPERRQAQVLAVIPR